MIMALVEEGVRQRLRQRFLDLPEPIFNECLRSNASNLDLCIHQLSERRSQVQESGDLMCGVSAGMDSAHRHIQQQAPPPPPPTLPQHNQQPDPSDGRINSDGWFELQWPPTMHAGSDKTNNNPPARTPEDQAATGGWGGYRKLYKFTPPVQVSKLSVNLKEGGNRAKTPRQSEPKNSPSPSRTCDAGNGTRTPSSTPDSSGLELSINLPGLSSPMPRDSPTYNPFFPPLDHQALRASQSNGRSSPGVAYPPSAGGTPPQHTASNARTSPSTHPSLYNSHVSQPPMPAVVQQPTVVSSHPVSPHPLNNPEPRQDVRRKTSQPSDPTRWADPYQPRPEVGVPSGAARPRSRTDVQDIPTYTSSHQRPALQGCESTEYRHRMGSQEELAYNQALIMHQNARKERLKKDLKEEQNKLAQMREEIRTMEQDLNTKRSHRSHFPSDEQLSKLREEKRQLQIDIECMNKEIDMFKKQGFVDPQSQIYFYENIESGPTGPIPPGPPGPPVSEQPVVLDPDEGQQWSCTHCTFLNHPFLDKCECCEMPRDNV